MFMVADIHRGLIVSGCCVVSAVVQVSLLLCPGRAGGWLLLTALRTESWPQYSSSARPPPAQHESPPHVTARGRYTGAAFSHYLTHSLYYVLDYMITIEYLDYFDRVQSKYFLMVSCREPWSRLT